MLYDSTYIITGHELKDVQSREIFHNLIQRLDNLPGDIQRLLYIQPDTLTGLVVTMLGMRPQVILDSRCSNDLLELLLIGCSVEPIAGLSCRFWYTQLSTRFNSPHVSIQTLKAVDGARVNNQSKFTSLREHETTAQVVIDLDTGNIVSKQGQARVVHAGPCIFDYNSSSALFDVIREGWITYDNHCSQD